MMTDALPPEPAALPVCVELRGPTWQPLAESDTRSLVAARASEAIADFGGSLGLCVAPDVDVRMVGAAEHDWPPLGLRIASRTVRYSSVLYGQVVHTVDASGNLSQVDRLITIAALLCRHACALQAGVLLGPGQVAAYAARLEQHGVKLPAESAERWLHDVISGVLDLGISVMDVPAVADVLTQRESDHVPAVREALTARLAAGEIQVLAPNDVVRHVGTFDADIESELLALITAAICEETGVAMPPLRMTATDMLPATFALRVNDVTTAPMPLLTADTLLVDASPELVRLVCPDVAPSAVTLPVPERATCIVAAEHRAALEEAGFSWWDREGQFTHAVAFQLRERIGWYVHQDRLQAQLDALQEQTPRTVLAARTVCPPWQLAVLVRGLATDQIPVTDLPQLLERLIELTYLDVPQARLSLLGDPVTAIGAYPLSPDHDRHLESFVRTGMCQAIGQARLAGHAAVDVVLLDPATERRLREGADDESVDEALLASVADWLSTWSDTTQVPGLLVGDDVRARVADTLRPVYPSIRVTGYGDLPAELLVVPQGRISRAGTDEEGTR